MNDAEDRQRIREAAGEIVAALAREAGKAQMTMSRGSLQRCLVSDRLERDARAAAERVFQTAFHYVLAAGYVERGSTARDALDRNPREFYQLAARGMQLWLGNVRDEAVDLSVYQN